MLTIYRSEEELPDNIKSIRLNDTFFDLNTTLSNTELDTEILKTIDDADYVSPLVFIGRYKDAGGLNKDLLSTGTKTLLNIIHHPNQCFDLLECGSIVDDFMMKISLLPENRSVVWRQCVCMFDDDLPCNIMYHGKHFAMNHHR